LTQSTLTDGWRHGTAGEAVFVVTVDECHLHACWLLLCRVSTQSALTGSCRRGTAGDDYALEAGANGLCMLVLVDCCCVLTQSTSTGTWRPGTAGDDEALLTIVLSFACVDLAACLPAFLLA
jgi:hypothetical protein